MRRCSTKFTSNFFWGIDVEAATTTTKGDASFTWDDVVIGASETSSVYLVTEDEIIAFASRYDPLPIHLDREIAAAGPFGSLTASGVHMLAIRMRLVHDFAYGGGVIASIGLDEVRYLAPLRAGQACQVEIKFLEKRPSAKHADRGVVIIEMVMRADGVPVASMKDIVLMRRRQAAASGGSA
jgi:acyl dehydratase